ncbi:MAG TPA: hypothetical protein VLU43_10095 [Anaeromyxobacteraceae bacterium]|nr:hypothetical protein [Anaeromyxobacteraceae bacterium]
MARRQARHDELLVWVRLTGALLCLMAAPAVLHAVALVAGAPLTAAEALGPTANALAAFVLVETAFVPLEGWLAARAGRARLLALGAALFALGALAGAGSAARPAWWAVAGAGAGLLFGTSVAPALKRLASRRARCVAATACACGLALGLGMLLPLTRAPQLLAATLVLGAIQAVVLLEMAIAVVGPHARLPPGGAP